MARPTKGLPMPRPPLPDVSNVFDQDPRGKRWAQDLTRMVQEALNNRSPDDTGRHQLILLDATGAAWGVTIDTLGNLTTTKLKG